MRYYAGIGSRETPENDQVDMMNLARQLHEYYGFVLRSGGAEGADQAFEAGCDRAEGKKEIFYATDHLPMWTKVLVDYFHPAPYKLSDYAFKLMQRNAMQILGEDGDTPVEFVVCWTSDGKDSGGTGQAIRIARYFGIPVFNQYRHRDMKKLRKFLDEPNTD